MSDSINEKDDDDIVVVEGRQKGHTVVADEDDDDDKSASDSRTSADNSEDDDDDGDDREAIRERRRLEKKERRERRETAMRRDKTELDFLRGRNEDLERRMMRIENESQQNQLSNIDAQIVAARQRANLAEQVFAKAVAAQNGEDAAKAMTYRDEARTMVAQLESYKSHHQNQAAQQREQQGQVRQQQQNEMSTTVQRLAQKFISDNDWYDPQGRDEDSAIVMAIDSTLTKEGYDPATEEYWSELKDRAARRIPERFQTEKQRSTRQPQGGPSLGSGREGRNTSGRREVYISPERKQAMLDAGVWDDPVLRAKYVKRYEQYDRDNKSRR
jgi:hypothetical protein